MTKSINELESLSSKIKLPKEQMQKLESFINTQLEKMHMLISSIEDMENSHNKQLQNIKEECRKKLKPYIKSLKITKEIADSTNDIKQSNKLAVQLSIFQLFQEDSQKAMNIFSLVKFSKILDDEMEQLRKDGKCNCPDSEEFLKTMQINKKLYEMTIPPMADLEQFFDGYNITKEIIITSTSIYIFKVFRYAFDIKDNTLKEALEHLLASLGITIGINLKSIKKMYLKAIYKDSYIFANATTKDVFSPMSEELYAISKEENFDFTNLQSNNGLYDFYFQIEAKKLLDFLQK